MSRSNNTSHITLIYVSESGEEYTQPLADITDAGTLIDPETGDDMVLIGWEYTGPVTGDPTLSTSTENADS